MQSEEETLQIIVIDVLDVLCCHESFQKCLINAQTNVAAFICGIAGCVGKMYYLEFKQKHTLKDWTQSKWLHFDFA